MDTLHTVGATPASEREARFREIIEQAFRERPGALDRPSGDVADAVNNWFSGICHRLDRWPCDDEGCPARPAWDVALDDLYGRVTTSLERRVERMIGRTFLRELMAFAEAHPEARWAPEPEGDPA